MMPINITVPYSMSTYATFHCHFQVQDGTTPTTISTATRVHLTPDPASPIETTGMPAKVQGLDRTMALEAAGGAEALAT